MVCDCYQDFYSKKGAHTIIIMTMANKKVMKTQHTSAAISSPAHIAWVTSSSPQQPQFPESSSSGILHMSFKGL